MIAHIANFFGKTARLYRCWIDPATGAAGDPASKQES
jgi:hypothetical protein